MISSDSIGAPASPLTQQAPLHALMSHINLRSKISEEINLLFNYTNIYSYK
ncbi:MAG: hypothetical protein P8I93_03865 [Crocinitomicaceae bacterium]|nr:hypothetical protein [Crocinitomicaceae bacterium]